MNTKKLSVFALFALITIAGCKKPDASNPTNNDPVLTVSDLNSPSDGNIILAPFNGQLPNVGNLYMLDKTGKIIQSKKIAHYALNFQKWTNNNQVRYTYTEFNPAGYHIQNLLYAPGDAVILDENMNEIKRINFLPNNNRPADQTLVDSHDFILLSDNHYILMTYYEKKVTNIPASLNPAPGVKVASPIIQEVMDDKVIWEWDASNYPELYTSSVEGNNFNDTTQTKDYAHMNSLFIDPKDSNLIISFRNLNQIIKVNHKDGSIIWRLGGANSDFPLTADQQTVRQHNATLTDNGQTLLVFDNGETTQRPNTRIDEFQLDEVNKKIISFKSLPVSNNQFTQYMGSVQKRGSTYFIGGGTANYVMEMDNTTGKILFQLKMNQPTYRAFKF